nr:hypothetical protein GCM10020093_028640 [Planobispora longispora]
MDWSFGEIVSYASRGVDLLPGDVFGSGTVPGCCLVEHLSLADPAAFPGWLHDGDVVELAVEGWAAPARPSARPPRRTRWRAGATPTSRGGRASTAPRRSCPTRAGCTRSARACGPGCCPTAGTAGATRA